MSFISAPGGSTIYIEDIGGIINYSIDSGSPTPLSWPTTIENYDTNLGFLKVIFRTDITITADSTAYFECGSEYIQFGDTSLRPNGARATITIDNITEYPGLIKNGAVDIIFNETQGYSNINIFNLAVLAINGSTLKSGGGWIGQEYFAIGATNTIANCYSDGLISTNSGGIVGQSAGKVYGEYLIPTPANLRIIGCSSTGEIGENGGGIAGSTFCTGNSSPYSTGLISESFSAGQISVDAGGIAGLGPGNTSGSPPTFTISKCYSTGTISDVDAGGIVGFSSLSTLVENSYSSGNILGGGIFGSSAGNTSTYALANNCYSTGTITTNPLGGGGIFSAFIETYSQANNCYTSGSNLDASGGIFGGSDSDTDAGNPYGPRGANNYSEANHGNSGTWSNTNANNNVLIGVPTPSVPVGATWALDPEQLVNGPYILSSFGYTPYSVANIDLTDPNAPTLVKTYGQTIQVGGTTNPAVITAGHTFYILAIDGAVPSTYPTISIAPSSGAITAAAGTAIGTYTIVIYDKINPYTTTQFVLTLTEPPPPAPSASDVCCVSSSTYKGLSADEIADYRVGSRLLTERASNPRMKFPSYEEYMKYKKAVAGAKKR